MLYRRSSRGVRARGRHATLCSALVALALLLGIGSAYAQDDKFFLSAPGPLSQSHADLEKQDQCNDCHTGGRGLSNDKCLGCHEHKDLRARIQAGKGFHASAQVKGKKCEQCHLEHKGRQYDIMGWPSIPGGVARFNHDLTGWPRQGKHAAVDCSACHKKKNKQGLRVFLGEDSMCGSCHANEQPHGFTKKPLLNCERCHNVSVWRPARRDLEFDHNSAKDAAMPLEGTHADVACTKCHPKNRFSLGNAKPDACGNCHKSPHSGHLFDKRDCDWCHSPKVRKLTQIQFNHGQRTKFALEGAHAKVTCYNCHTKKVGTKVPDRSCAQCHADDNPHEQRFAALGTPPKCENCHSSGTFKTYNLFQHSKLTTFALRGKHAKADCRSCHRGKGPADFERFDPATVGCMGCHKHASAHNGEFQDNQCLKCHKTEGSKVITSNPEELKKLPQFVAAHGPTDPSFALVDGHNGVACVDCHQDEYAGTPTECGEQCHADAHEGALGETCTKCHRNGVWKPERFDHTEDTTWPLKGLHQKVSTCNACHKDIKFDGTPTTCSAEGCHAKDDVHKGKLGAACDKCHRETGENFFNHNTMSAFKLTDKHLQVKCSQCHKSIEFKPRPQNCYGCHPEPAVHKGQYGTACENCHTAKSWQEIQALHDVGDFALKGAHDQIPCVRCHKDSRPLGGSGNLCINCHRQDDIHSNSLSPRCGECHTQWSFAPARFDHSTVGCNLTGLHRTLPCYDCHKTGSFGGLADACASCHIDLAAAQTGRPGDTIHTPTPGSCAGAGCHNPNSWQPATGIPAVESICR